MKSSLVSKLLMLLVLSTSLLAHAEEPLMPDQAFKFNAEVINDTTLRGTWTIAEGYYLYKDKISFESGTPGVAINKVTMPKGKLKHGILPDGTEGMVEVYFHNISVDVPLQRSDTAINEFKLIAKSQGCSEKFGICYPPQKREQTLALTAATKSNTSALMSLKSFGNQLGAQANDGPLPAEQAFATSAIVMDSKTVRVTWMIAADYYMYRDKFKFSSGTDGVTLGAAQFPQGKMHHGITPEGKEGEVEVYFEHVMIDIPFTNSSGNAVKFNLIAEGQGCAEKLGICYPPQKRTLSLDLPASGKTDLTAANILWRLLIAFGSGFILTFTPCVLPMLPILCSIILGQGQNVSRARCAGLSSTYVLGTTVVWTIAGVVAGATGQQLQAYTSHPYFVIPVAVVLVLLALAMFGVYNLQMPASLQSRAQEKSSSAQSGTYAGVFIMGVLGSIIAGACVSPILILNLGVALETHSPVLGGAIMFLMAVGMGVPIIMIGMGAGWLLPKAGGWMDTVKYAFGVILIGLALYVVTPVASIPVMYLWATLLIGTGVAMGMFQKSAFPSRTMQILWKIVAVLLIMWGALSFQQATQGERNIFANPIKLTTHTTTGDVHLFKRVTTLDEIERLLNEAKQQGKPAILDYYATWCTDCNIMERTVFVDPGVQKLLREKFILVQADVSDQFAATTQPMKDKFGIFGPPAMLFFDKQGNEHKDLRRYGKMTKEEFLNLVNPLAN